MLYGQAWTLLAGIRNDARPDSPVFMSRQGGHLDPSAVWRIVKAAAARAGLPVCTSPHWLRHSHASHSLHRGAPLSLAQQGLGHASVATASKYLHAQPSDGAGRYLGVWLKRLYGLTTRKRERFIAMVLRTVIGEGVLDLVLGHQTEQANHRAGRSDRLRFVVPGSRLSSRDVGEIHVKEVSKRIHVQSSLR